MSDWDHDGDEDFTDGLAEGAFWYGPWQLAFLVVVVSLLVLAWRAWH